MTKPLAGLKVLELARVLAGPWAGQLLADLGADVVKVERAGVGDDTRRWGPPFVEGAGGEPLSAGYFHSTNRGKRSVQADFESEQGRTFVRQLASHADVVIENFKVGGLKRHGLDYEALSKINRRLIYCSITGFGQTGPMAGDAGYDFVVQGLAGAMDLTGAADGPPTKAGYATADLFCGLYSTVAILAALRRRDEAGAGAHLDMALLDSQVAVLGYQAVNYFISGQAPARMGNGHPTIAPYDVFPCRDGPIILAVGNDAQFAKLCLELGAPELSADARFATNPARLRNREALTAELQSLTGKFQVAELDPRLSEVHVPAGVINSVAAVFENPQVVARGLRIDRPCEGAVGGAVPGLRSPIVIDGAPMAADLASPGLGQHDAEVRADAAWGG